MLAAIKRMAWYIRELMGDNDYARYPAQLRQIHPAEPVPTEREYWRARWADQDVNPRGRCC